MWSESPCGQYISNKKFCESNKADLQAQNAVQIAHDDLPFGGTKHSGYGKEHSTEVLDYYTEQKPVVAAS